MSRMSAGVASWMKQIRVTCTSPWLHATPSAGVTSPDMYL